MSAIIQLRKVEKRYVAGGVVQPVLRGIDLEVAPGELLAIVGTSGSGKTTLLNIIGGLDGEFSGQVCVDGQDLARLSDVVLSRFRNHHIGFVFQSFNLLDHLSCAENVALPSCFGPDAQQAPARAAELLERVGLADYARRRPNCLSGGQKQRVAIARALFSRPPILLCDEPTGNLDTETGHGIIGIFRQLNRDEGITLVIVTHEERVSEVASRVIRLEDGRITGARA